jgi:hypothetical protein
VKVVGCAGVLALALLAATTSSVEAQARPRWVPGERMTDAMTKMMATVRAVSDKTTFGYDNGVCLMAAFVPEKGKVAFNRQLVKDQRYAILAVGEGSVQDLDLEVVDDRGRVVASDTKADPEAVVIFRAPATGTYTLRLHLFKARSASFCAVAVLREGGYDVPVRNLTDAASGLIAEGTRLHESKRGRSVTFLDTPNQWAVYGSVLKPGEDVRITGLQFGVGERALLAAGDTNSTDIDLWLEDENGKNLDSDTDPDARPKINLFAKHRPSHGMRVKNVAARGPALVLSAILQVAD